LCPACICTTAIAIATVHALTACGIVLLVFALNELRCARTGCPIRTSFYGGRLREEIAAQEWDPKTLVRGSEAQGGLDREGEEGRPFGIGGKEFERGEKAVGARWQARECRGGDVVGGAGGREGGRWGGRWWARARSA
jgi:hypothetical protein